MSPYPLGGNKFARSPWYLAPNLPPLTLEERRRGPVRPAQPVAERPALQWEPSELDGPQTITVRGRVFNLPADARVKRRLPLCWVLINGLVHVLSERGDLLLDAEDRVRFAQLWESI
jgi:hypothetical protein